MSIKKEVQDLTKVYSTIVKESFPGMEVSDITPDVPTSVSPEDQMQQIGGEEPVVMPSNLEPSMSSGLEDCDQEPEGNLSMARSEVYSIHKYACELHKMLQDNSLKIEPWQLSKLSVAQDYLCSITSALDYREYENMGSELNSGMGEMGSPVVVKIREMLAGEPMSVNEEILKQVIFNIECLKEAN